MAIEALEAPQVIEEAGPQHWKWTGDGLQRLTEAGVFPPDARVELMDGVILKAMAPSPRHSLLVTKLLQMFWAFCDQQTCYVQSVQPVRLNPHFEPVPDLALIRGPITQFEERFPGPEDVLLIVEVAQSSLTFDRREKQQAYAAAGIPEYWIVNLRDNQVEVFRQPEGEAYASTQIYTLGEAVPVPVKPEATITVAALLGQAAEAS